MVSNRATKRPLCRVNLKRLQMNSAAGFFRHGSLHVVPTSSQSDTVSGSHHQSSRLTCVVAWKMTLKSSACLLSPLCQMPSSINNPGDSELFGSLSVVVLERLWCLVKTLMSPTGGGHPTPTGSLRWRTDFPVRNAERLQVLHHICDTCTPSAAGSLTCRANFAFGSVRWHTLVLHLLQNVKP